MSQSVSFWCWIKKGNKPFFNWGIIQRSWGGKDATKYVSMCIHITTVQQVDDKFHWFQQ